MSCFIIGPVIHAPHTDRPGVLEALADACIEFSTVTGQIVNGRTASSTAPHVSPCHETHTAPHCHTPGSLERQSPCYHSGLGRQTRAGAWTAALPGLRRPARARAPVRLSRDGHGPSTNAVAEPVRRCIRLHTPVMSSHSIATRRCPGHASKTYHTRSTYIPTRSSTSAHCVLYSYGRR